MEIGALRFKIDSAEMRKGRVIMDVTAAERAQIAEGAGDSETPAVRLPGLRQDEAGIPRASDDQTEPNQKLRILAFSGRSA